MKIISKYLLQAAGALSLLSVMAGCDAFGTDDTGFTPETPQLSVLADAVENVPREKTTLTIAVTANLPWRASADVGWITFEKGRGDGNGDCVIVVSLNTTRNERTGTVKIWITDDAVQTFKITQAPTVPGTNPMDYYVKTGGDASADGLSWANATTLANAMEMAVFGDVIHVAAGKYTPWATATGGNTSNVGDKTFEFDSNITVIGGYPADAAEGAVYDPLANETVLSGAMADGTSFHVVVIIAEADPEWKLKLKGITISGGATNPASSSFPINGTSINRNQAAAIVMVNSYAEFEDCTIKGNTASANGNIYITTGSVASFENCLISGNTCAVNSAAIFNSGSTVNINNCTFNANMAEGVGGPIYSYHATAKSYTYIYNSTFTGNMVNSGGANATRRGGAIYARENSEMVVVNCTFSGNQGGNGGAISAYGTAAAPCKVDIINCTITGNTAQTSGGGVDIANTSATVKMYNTIVSGNTAAVTANNDIFFDGGSSFSETKSYVAGTNVYDVNNTLVSSTFDTATMLGTLADNGGKTSTIALTGSSNPALTYGMSMSDLSALGLGYNPEIPADVITYDQRGISRSGKTAIGAWVDE